jgi:hypothetical protein
MLAFFERFFSLFGTLSGYVFTRGTAVHGFTVCADREPNADQRHQGNGVANRSEVHRSQRREPEIADG